MCKIFSEFQYEVICLILLVADDLLANKAQPPPEEEFIDIFQKFKYCFTLLVGVQCGWN